MRPILNEGHFQIASCCLPTSAFLQSSSRTDPRSPSTNARCSFAAICEAVDCRPYLLTAGSSFGNGVWRSLSIFPNNLRNIHSFFFEPSGIVSGVAEACHWERTAKKNSLSLLLGRGNQAVTLGVNRSKIGRSSVVRHKRFSSDR